MESSQEKSDAEGIQEVMMFKDFTGKKNLEPVLEGELDDAASKMAQTSQESERVPEYELCKSPQQSSEKDTTLYDIAGDATLDLFTFHSDSSKGETDVLTSSIESREEDTASTYLEESVSKMETRSEATDDDVDCFADEMSPVAALEQLSVDDVDNLIVNPESSEIASHIHVDEKPAEWAISSPGQLYRSMVLETLGNSESETGEDASDQDHSGVRDEALQPSPHIDRERFLQAIESVNAQSLQPLSVAVENDETHVHSPISSIPEEHSTEKEDDVETTVKEVNDNLFGPDYDSFEESDDQQGTLEAVPHQDDDNDSLIETEMEEFETESPPCEEEEEMMTKMSDVPVPMVRETEHDGQLNEDNATFMDIDGMKVQLDGILDDETVLPSDEMYTQDIVDETEDSPVVQPVRFLAYRSISEDASDELAVQEDVTLISHRVVEDTHQTTAYDEFNLPGGQIIPAEFLEELHSVDDFRKESDIHVVDDISNADNPDQKALVDTGSVESNIEEEFNDAQLEITPDSHNDDDSTDASNQLRLDSETSDADTSSLKRHDSESSHYVTVDEDFPDSDLTESDSAANTEQDSDAEESDDAEESEEESGEEGEESDEVTEEAASEEEDDESDAETSDVQGSDAVDSEVADSEATESEIAESDIAASDATSAVSGDESDGEESDESEEEDDEEGTDSYDEPEEDADDVTQSDTDEQTREQIVETSELATSEGVAHENISVSEGEDLSNVTEAQFMTELQRQRSLDDTVKVADVVEVCPSDASSQVSKPDPVEAPEEVPTEGLVEEESMEDASVDMCQGESLRIDDTEEEEDTEALLIQDREREREREERERKGDHGREKMQGLKRN
ncbi:surface protein-like [Haliotis rubra]|uniref:surface protein-like n=1 Tax=Haliotis rubra TaxID=36100 RepID=UPI001EE56BA8|nr:surface protein-like [Haliotis rubra]